MNGIDIASYQAGIDLKKVPCDFVIIKATEGTSYVNPDAARAFAQAKKAGLLIGFYHYAAKGGSQAEAKHFLNTVKSIAGDENAIYILDWERGGNVNFGDTAYAKAWLDYVKANTGRVPFIYMSKSVCASFYGTGVAEHYPLWCAQYKNYHATGYQTNPWTDKFSFAPWDKPLIYQYSSNGRLKGWNGPLDLDISYMDEDLWLKYGKHFQKQIYPKPVEGGSCIVDTSDYPTVRKGNKNEWVRLLQQGLSARGYAVANDGIFGGKTLAAVKQFQKDNDLEVDGIVGPRTWRALFV